MTQENRKSPTLKNLRSQSFKNKPLSGEDFSHCDIRGADFTNATLTGAKFCHAKAGQPIVWVLGIITGTLLLTGLAGYISAYAAGVISSIMFMEKSQPIGLVSGIISLLILAVLLWITAWKGLGRSLAAFVFLLVITIVLIAALGTAEQSEASAQITAAAIVQTVAIAGAIAGSILTSIALTTLKILTRKLALPLFLSIATVGSIFGGWEGLKRGTDLLIQGIPGAAIITIVLLAFSIYTSQQVIHHPKKYWLIHKTANFLTSVGGTRFQSANLTDADFTQATLPSTDFRHATLTRTCWLSAQNLDQSRLEGTYLENSHIRQLATSKISDGLNFRGENLHELNLAGRSLQGIDFTGANLSEATLENADLTKAKLISTQLYRANLNGTCLTGAYIEDWGISPDTQYRSIQCDYIHMRLPTDQDSYDCRKPDDRTEIFKPGDFDDFIGPMFTTLSFYKTQNRDPRQVTQQFKTLDLVLYNDIDPNAAALALFQLSEQYPQAELDLLSIQGKGVEKLRLETKISQHTDPEKLNASFLNNYEVIQTQLTQIPQVNELMSHEFTKLSKLIESVKSDRNIYIQIGELNMESKGNVSFSNVQGNISGVAASGENQTMTGVAIGAISGSVTNTINQLPDSPDPNQPGLKELLTQLQAAIEAAQELSDDDKTESLEQIKTLAEAGQKPEDGILQKAAKTSMKILKGTIASLPNAAQLAESCAKLLPAIAALLALA